MALAIKLGIETPILMTQQYLKQQSYIKLWIWRRKTSQYAASTYQHTAIEIYRGENRGEYISFWASNHRDHPRCNENNVPHFHKNKALDDRALQGTQCVSYILCLETVKIYAAFKQIQKDCLAMNNLWLKTLRSPFILDNAGVTGFLLSQGGIFNYTSPLKKNLYSETLKKVSILGIGFASLNYISTYLFPLDDIEDVFSFSYCYLFAMTSLACIGEMSQTLIDLDPEFESVVAKYPALKRVHQAGLRNLDNLNFSPGTDYIEASTSVTDDIIKISKYGFAIAVGTFALSYLIDQFAFPGFTYADIERLVKKTMQAQAWDRLKNQSPVMNALRSANL